MALLTLVTRGALQRFPTLRVAFMEAGCSWLPYWLYRLDEHVELTGWKDAPGLDLLPSEYFKRQCWIACEPDEELARFVVEVIGDDRLVFASDFPHPDSKYPDTVATFLGLPGLTGENRRRMLFDNAVEFYRFDAASLPIGKDAGAVAAR